MQSNKNSSLELKPSPTPTNKTPHAHREKEKQKETSYETIMITQRTVDDRKQYLISCFTRELY